MQAIITNKFRLHNALTLWNRFQRQVQISIIWQLVIKHLLHQQVAIQEHNLKAQMSPLTPTDSVSDEFYFFDDVIAAKELLHQMYLE